MLGAVRWVFACALVLSIGGVAAHAAPPPKVIFIPERKFDHAKHAEEAAKATNRVRRVAKCADCHQLDDLGVRRGGAVTSSLDTEPRDPSRPKIPGLGRREHTHRCATICHVDPPQCTPAVTMAGPKSAGRRCQVCHEFENCKIVKVPPPPAPSFQAGFTHGEHIKFGAAIERECANCHRANAQPGTTKYSGHALCVDCHKIGGRGTTGANKVDMKNCEGCHQPPKPRVASTDPFHLGSFDHQKHHAASGNQATCTKCHSAKKIEGVGKAAVPRPDMLTCQLSCHNAAPGAQPFSAVGTNCRKCHQPATPGAARANLVDMRFMHDHHAKRGVDTERCADCHSVKSDGKLEPPGHGKDHAPCAKSGCHEVEFASKTPKICGVCHDESMPWQQATARHKPVPNPEWFETIDHAAHLTRTVATECVACHGDKLTGGTPPDAHVACAQCHNQNPTAHTPDGRAHAIDKCQKCHVATKPATAAATEWSVAATFTHVTHAIDPKTKQPTACTVCHADVKDARTLASIKNPTMKSCSSCHDGKSAFKTTGHECARCHTRPKPVVPQG